MYTINKILVPTDFSENASKAYTHAQQIAERYGAQIDFIHIIPMLGYFNKSLKQLGMPLDMDKDVYPHAQKQASDQINQLMDVQIKQENKGKAIVKIAPKPSKAIAEFAEKGKYDLIVIAAKGKNESDLLRGSVTEKLIRYSKVPVLHTDQSEIEQTKNIMLPTDGSQESLKALPVALSIALKNEASITLFHVLELHGTLTENAMKNVHGSENENIRDVIYDALDEYFEKTWNKAKLQRGKDFESQIKIIDESSNATINVQTVIEKGVSAHDAVNNYGDEYSNLIVLATHGHSGLKHLILGSTAEKIVQHSVCPTVTVKPNFVVAD